MALPTLPSSERIFASLVVLALATALGLGLALTYNREIRAAAPGQQPPAQSRLLAVLGGVMAVNVSLDETTRFQAWVETGATRGGFAQVEAVVANTCASCHGQGGQVPRITCFEDLRPLALEAAPQGLTGLMEARTLHLLGFPLILLVAGLGYLRRIAWRGRKVLLGGVALAVVFDTAQWWPRQGRPGSLWAAWTGLVLLAGAMAAMVAVVLKELWTTPCRSKPWS